MNRKGQAFSVFELLIAAVVALAILGILVSLLGIDLTGILGGAAPQKKATELAQRAQTNVDAIQKEKVTFSSANNRVAKTAIENSSVGTTYELCFAKDTDLSDEEFELNGGITYQKSTNRDVQLRVICSADYDSAKAEIDNVVKLENGFDVDSDCKETGKSCIFLVSKS